MYYLVRLRERLQIQVPEVPADVMPLMSIITQLGSPRSWLAQLASCSARGGQGTTAGERWLNHSEESELLEAAGALPVGHRTVGRVDRPTSRDVPAAGYSIRRRVKLKPASASGPAPNDLLPYLPAADGTLSDQCVV